MLVQQRSAVSGLQGHERPPHLCLALNDGRLMPKIGCGTYVGTESGHTSPEDCAHLVAKALRVGYKHFDSALMYMNERELGAALPRVGNAGAVPEGIYITTKIAHPNDPNRGHTACSYMHDPSLDAEQGVLDNVVESYKKLRLGRPIDLVLLHWPGCFSSSDGPFNEKKRWDMWRGLEKAQSEGLCHSVGVSSFTQNHIEQLLARGPRIQPAVNQIQSNPLHANRELAEFCQRLGIAVCAWSPLGLGGEALQSPTLVAIAEKYGLSPAAVTLRWLIQRKIVPLPRSLNEDRLRDNLAAATDSSIELNASDIAAIDALDRSRSVFPDFVSPHNIA